MRRREEEKGSEGDEVGYMQWETNQMKPLMGGGTSERVAQAPERY